MTVARAFINTGLPHNGSPGTGIVTAGAETSAPFGSNFGSSGAANVPLRSLGEVNPVLASTTDEVEAFGRESAKHIGASE